MGKFQVVPLNLPETPQLVGSEAKDNVFEEFRLVYQAISALNDFYSSQQYGTPFQTSNDFANSPFYTTPKVLVECLEDIPTNKLVHLRTLEGKVVAYLADSTFADRFANGVAVTGATKGNRVRVGLGAAGVCGFTGLVPQANYFLGIAGNILPSISGVIIQPVGIATSSTCLYYHHYPPISTIS